MEHFSHLHDHEQRKYEEECLHVCILFHVDTSRNTKIKLMPVPSRAVFLYETATGRIRPLTGINKNGHRSNKRWSRYPYFDTSFVVECLMNLTCSKKIVISNFVALSYNCFQNIPRHKGMFKLLIIGFVICFSG